MVRLALILTIVFHSCHSVLGSEITRPSPMTVAIDDLISARLRSESITPSAGIDDAMFARRVTLDLAGRIPTISEMRQFLANDAADRRQKLVEQLLDSPDFALHLRNELDRLLLAPLKIDEDWRDYLLSATRENRSWDQLFREVMLPERHLPDNKGPAVFLHHRAKDLDSMTNDASAIFFGVNISCAKCHDHPLVGDWQQQHYYGLASFFHRTYPTRTGFVGERFDGELKFTTVYGDEENASFMFLSGASVTEPSIKRDAETKKVMDRKIRDAQRNNDAPPPPLPDFSPRAELVKLALQRNEHDFFARNIVNRLWARLLGRGLVHPLDQMHSANPPSHPRLLKLLASDFADHGYDLRRTIHDIVLSDTYARSSRISAGADRPSPELFACGTIRPLTPWQLSLSLSIATSHPDHVTGLMAPQWQVVRERMEDFSNTAAGELENPSDIFQVGSDEALWFSNSDRINELLTDNDKHLVGFLAGQKDDDELIEIAFLATLSRTSTDSEKGAISLHLAQRAADRVAAIQHVVWALLASPEFRFNH